MVFPASIQTSLAGGQDHRIWPVVLASKLQTGPKWSLTVDISVIHVQVNKMRTCAFSPEEHLNCIWNTMGPIFFLRKS